MRHAAIRRPSAQPPSADRGYAMAALLVAMSVMAIVMSVALPVWATAARREKEAELVFRGEQYARAIAFYQRQTGGAFPPSLDLLIDQKFLRTKYRDPITGGEFETLAPGSVLAGSSTPGALVAGRSGTGAAAAGGRGGTASIGGRGGTTNVGGRGGTANAAGTRGTAQSGGRSTGSTLSTRLGIAVGASLGIMGVRSKSTDQSLRVYKGAERYNEWLFLATEATNAAGTTVTGTPTPTGGGIGGRGGERGGRGEGRAGRGEGRGGRGEGRGGRGGRGDGGGRGVDGGGRRSGGQPPFGGGGTSPFGGRGRGF